MESTLLKGILFLGSIISVLLLILFLTRDKKEKPAKDNNKNK